MNKPDKARVLGLVPIRREQSNLVSAQVVYDVSKLRRMGYAALAVLLFHKTVKLYPFAIVDTEITYQDIARKTASIYVWLPLSPEIRLSETRKEGAE